MHARRRGRDVRLRDTGDTLLTVIGRSLVLVFIAPVVGRAAERAASSRRLLEQLLEAATDSIYVKDLDGRDLPLNSAAARLIGRPGREIVVRTNPELLPEVAPRSPRAISRCSTSEPPRPARSPDASAGSATCCRSRRARSARSASRGARRRGRLVRTVDEGRMVYASGRDVTQKLLAGHSLSDEALLTLIEREVASAHVARGG